MDKEYLENKQIREKYTFTDPIEIENEPDAHSVYLKVGVQSFYLNNCEDKKHADWMRDMLSNALGNMVREIKNQSK